MKPREFAHSLCQSARLEGDPARVRGFQPFGQPRSVASQRQRHRAMSNGVFVSQLVAHGLLVSRANTTSPA